MSDPGQELDDPSRLGELASLPLGEAEVQSALDAITAKAAEAFELPISLVSIVLDSAQFFAGANGLGGWLAETRGTPVEWAFCRHVVEGSDPFLVENAATDERVADNPLVTQDGIRCYLGVPLKTAQGNRLGSLCVIGTEAREFSEEEVARLRGFAQEAVDVLHQASSKDD